MLGKIINSFESGEFEVLRAQVAKSGRQKNTKEN